MSIQHANSGVVKKDLQLYYNREFSKCFRGEATTNLIGTYGVVGINSYPSAFNNWGTYQARTPYNGGSYFSIGTISSVSGNIVTLSSPSSVFANLATYDVIRPQTTGGGVVADTDYYFKKISSTTFSLHQYDATNDGSKTPEQILYYINNDIKISVNSTSFPTMWWGYPHQPNSALIKTAITNGFSFDNRYHDCLRLYWFRGDAADGMAYGVYPSYTGNTVYTFSAYVRAIDQNAIGKTITLNTYYSGPNVGGPASTSPTLTTTWQRWTLTFTSNATTGAMIFYFFAGYAPMVADIAEIQFEQKGYVTEFAVGSRSANTVAGGGGLLDMSGNNNNADLTNATFDTNGYIFSGSQYITVPYSSNFDRNDFTITGYCRTSTNDNSHDTILSRNSDVYGTNGNGWNISRLRNGLSLANCFRFMIYGDSTTASEVQGPAIADNVWRHFAVVVDKSVSNTAMIYINGILYSTLGSLPTGNHYPSSGSPPLYIGCNKTNTDLWNGDIAQVLYYQRALTASEVLQNFNATRKTYGL